MYYGYYDATYILVLVGAAICLIAQARVKSTFSRYANVATSCGMTGEQMAKRILLLAGLNHVDVEHISGDLTDHYDPRSRTVRLSDSVYNKNSVSAVAVAAHECGHAIQHEQQYFPLSFRSALVPVANLGSNLAWPLIIIGLFFNSGTGALLLQIGVLAFSLSVLFQLVTLPVEFNASHRALLMMADNRLVADDELRYSKKVLKAAALTYVASAAASILQLLRLLLIVNGRRRD